MFSIYDLITYLPTVAKPTFRPSFNSKLKWTFLALSIYFLLGLIPIYGVHPIALERFKFFELVLGAKFGTLTTLGIGPIVTSGIILQLLVGSKIIDWKLDEEADRKKFQAWSKTLAFLFVLLEAIGMVLGGVLPVYGGIGVLSAVILQLAIGGILIILLDELVSKWGMGSGISLFIVAGVASSLFISLFSPFAVYQYSVNGRIVTKVGLPSFENPPAGYLWKSIFSLVKGDISSFLMYFLPIISTFLIFLFVCYIQLVGVEIPLSFASLRGFGRSWELKLMYTNVIPLILASALIANLQLVSNMAKSSEFNSVIFFLSPPQNFLQQLVSGIIIPIEVLRAITYTIFITILATIFSYIWVLTSGMDARSVAEQLESFGMQIPGFRMRSQIMENVLDKYIPSLAIWSGILIGLLASMANLLGTIGRGTGILLAVMIIYNYYEIMKREMKESEAPSYIKRFLGE